MSVKTMDEECICPRCNELVTLEFDDHYWENAKGEEIECVATCPKCDKTITIKGGVVDE